MLFVALFVVSTIVGLVAPIAGPAAWGVRLVGIPIAVAGLALTISSAGIFSRVGTNIVTFYDPDQFVTQGPFKFTRNPMYLGFSIALAGAAICIGSVSAWIGPVAFVVIANLWYIPFEEARMHATFGAAYDDYRRQVPRWLGRVTVT